MLATMEQVFATKSSKSVKKQKMNQTLTARNKIKLTKIKRIK
jgi:hypothetical protein